MRAGKERRPTSPVPFAGALVVDRSAHGAAVVGRDVDAPSTAALRRPVAREDGSPGSATPPALSLEKSSFGSQPLFADQWHEKKSRQDDATLPPHIGKLKI